MIARGKHIQTLNETSAMRKSGLGMDTSAPYGASAGMASSAEVREALQPSRKLDIDSVMAKRQEVD